MVHSNSFDSLSPLFFFSLTLFFLCVISHLALHNKIKIKTLIFMIPFVFFLFFLDFAKLSGKMKGKANYLIWKWFYFCFWHENCTLNGIEHENTIISISKKNTQPLISSWAKRGILLMNFERKLVFILFAKIWISHKFLYL